MRFAVERLREYTPSKVCRILNISRSSYYSKLHNGEMLIKQKETEYRAIYTTFKLHHGSFGRRVLRKLLLQKGFSFSEYKIAKALKYYGVCSKYGRKRCKNVHTSETTEKYIHENLFSQLSETEKKQFNVWSMDFTEQRIQGKKIYTCGIISVNKKVLVGYAQSKRCTSELAIKTILKAIEGYGVPDMVMTDRGCQFTSKAFFDIMQRYGITHSMSRPHKPVDNVYIETFWKTLKVEIGKLDLLNEQTYAMVIEYYIYYYNHLRPHSSLNYLPPLAA